MDLSRPFGLTSAQSAGLTCEGQPLLQAEGTSKPARLPRALFSQGLVSPRNGKSTASPRKLCQCLSGLTKSIYFSCILLELPLVKHSTSYSAPRRRVWLCLLCIFSVGYTPSMWVDFLTTQAHCSRIFNPLFTRSTKQWIFDAVFFPC